LFLKLNRSGFGILSFVSDHESRRELQELPFPTAIVSGSAKNRPECGKIMKWNPRKTVSEIKRATETNRYEIVEKFAERRILLLKYEKGKEIKGNVGKKLGKGSGENGEKMPAIPGILKRIPDFRTFFSTKSWKTSNDVRTDAFYVKEVYGYQEKVKTLTGSMSLRAFQSEHSNRKSVEVDI